MKKYIVRRTSKFGVIAKDKKEAITLVKNNQHSTEQHYWSVCNAGIIGYFEMPHEKKENPAKDKKLNPHFKKMAYVKKKCECDMCGGLMVIDPDCPIHGKEKA